MRNLLVRCLVLALLILTGSAAGALVNLPDLESGTMFIVNDPQEMAFVNLEALFGTTQKRFLTEKAATERDVANFWDAVRNHGAANAPVRACLVVPPENGADHGLLVLKGSFDKEKVLEIMARRFSEHVNEHLTDQRQEALGLGKPVKPVRGFNVHRFALPVRDRELLIVDLGETVVFASQKRGDTGLLFRTLDVLTGRIPLKHPAQRSGRVRYSFVPTAEERVRLLQQVDDSFNRYKEGRMEHRRGIRRFSEGIRNVVADRKVAGFKSALDDLRQATFGVDRFLALQNGKQMTLQLQFGSEATAQTVKAAAVKHMVAEVKKPENQYIRAALQNPRITAEGASVFLRVALPTEEDQRHAFAVMASFVARRIIGTRQPPVVRRLKGVADQQAQFGRRLEKELDVELARTSFFSLGRKFSLMFSRMKTRTDIRRCEDVYVDLKAEPKVLAESALKLAQASGRDLDILDKLIESRAKSAGKDKAIFAAAAFDLFRLRALRQGMGLNARTLLMTARSPAFRQAVGPGNDKMWKALQELGQKAGGPPLFAGGYSAGVPLPAGAPALALQKAPAGPAAVRVPEGLTLEKAQADYQAALEAYSQAAAAGDEARVRETYDLYLGRFQIYQALLDKLEAGKE